VLLAVALLDELWTGVPTLEAPAVERDHALAHGGVALTLFVVPQLLATLAEARLLLWAERGDRRRWMGAAQAFTALGALAAALAGAPWQLALAFGVTGTAAGVVAGLAQAALVDGQPQARERAMARWTLAAALGDLGAPFLLGAVALLGGSWRAALVGLALALLVHAVLLLRAAPNPTISPAADEPEPEPTVRAALRIALGNRMLLGWLGASALCSLLDEIMVAFAMLHLRQDRGASEGEAAAAAGAWAFGCTLGLVVSERLLARVPARALLGGGALVCALACATWWMASAWPLAALGLFVLGLGTAPLYPIAHAQCYAALPGRAVLVGVAASLFAPLELLAPWGLGVLADHHGLPVALLALGGAPLVLGVLALWPRAWSLQRSA
jgi:MFS transporter, FSR family, fosmidomycin resistance protein